MTDKEREYRKIIEEYIKRNHIKSAAQYFEQQFNMREEILGAAASIYIDPEFKAAFWAVGDKYWGWY